MVTKTNLIAKVLSIIVKIFLIIIFVFPFYWMINTGLKTYEEAIADPPTWWPQNMTFENFKTVWTAFPFPRFMLNSIIITVVTVLLQMFIVIPAAYAFARYDFKLKNFLFLFVLLGFMIPGSITFVSIYIMMAKLKLLNTLWPQIIPHVSSAFGLFYLRQAFMQVPDTVEEAARLDNANEFSIIYKVMVPMSKSAVLTFGMFSVLWRWNSFFWPLVMTNSDAVRPLTIGINMLKNIEGALNWELLMAGNVVLILPIILLYAIFSKRLVGSFVYTGIK